MLTNGDHLDARDNQPLSRGAYIAVHNGIIVNEQALWSAHPDLTRRARVDTEVFVALLDEYIRQGRSHQEAMALVFREIIGATTIAYASVGDGRVGLGTNNGSLYWVTDKQNAALAFSSEQRILTQAIKQSALQHVGFGDVQPVLPGETLFWDWNERRLTPGKAPPHLRAEPVPVIDIPSESRAESLVGAFQSTNAGTAAFEEKLLAIPAEAIAALRRCTRCILPETFPQIVFDAEGVCNYCREYKPLTYAGEEALKDSVRHRRPAQTPDAIVGLSGGRDSCYALHYAVRVLGLRPIAYTYDWGMITDLARRNISRLCGALGIEHVIVAANIGTKRANIRKNLLAWLKRPSLGTVPLLMAGDKAYFYHANRLMAQYRTPLFIMGENRLERTHFKHGFCGVRHRDSLRTAYDFGWTSNAVLVGFYLKEFLANPAFLNSSLLDTAWGYMSYYLLPHDYLYIYNYVTWNEGTIVRTLQSEYQWETDPETTSTWRIGDGTAAFYNYIYLRLAGFSEHDTFLSNQIREGLLSRTQALAQLQVSNQPRARAIREYLGVLRLDLAPVITAINNIPTLYSRR